MNLFLFFFGCVTLYDKFIIFGRLEEGVSRNLLGLRIIENVFRSYLKYKICKKFFVGIYKKKKKWQSSH